MEFLPGFWKSKNGICFLFNLIISFFFLFFPLEIVFSQPDLKTLRVSSTEQFGKGYFYKTKIDSTLGDGALQLSRSDENLALGKEATADVESSDPQYGAENVTDGNQSTFWFLGTGESVVDHWLQVDLGALRSIDHVVVYTFNYQSNGGEGAFPVAGYSLLLSESGEEGSWIQVVSSNQKTAIIDTTFEPHTTRFVRLLFTKSNPGVSTIISEFEVYGSGFSPSGYWLSGIDTLQKINFYALKWSGLLPEGTDLYVQIRSDSARVEHEPWVVTRDTVKLPRGHIIPNSDNFTDLQGTSLRGYYFFTSQDAYEEGFVTIDPAGISIGDTILLNYKLWSEWSPMTVDTFIVLSIPEPRAIFQTRVSFFTSSVETPVLQGYEVFYHDKLLIDSTRAYIEPDTVIVLDKDTLTYFLELYPQSGDIGFDTLRVYTPSPAEVIDVYLDNTPLSGSEIAIGEHLKSFDVAFQEHFSPSAPTVLKVRFRTTLFATISSFPAVLINGNIPFNPQWVDEDDRLIKVVTSGIPEKVLLNVKIAPNPFSPNGDNICDRTSVNFFIAKLAEPRKVEVNLYDLRGHLLRRLYQDYVVASPFQIIWDGRVNGKLVLPGVYLCEVRVATDSGTQTVFKPITVVY